ncbi:MAG: TIM barrel protein [Anaerolineae bacterium]|nr:TIM barrel protein [Anaerolineae bacterium]
MPRQLTRPPTIALSARWDTYPDRFRWIVEHGFALEYSPNPEAFDLLPKHVDPFLEAGIPVRHHGFFAGYEIGHHDAAIAERAMRVHMVALEAMRGRGEQVITFHVGLRREDQIDPGRAVENLSKLVEHGRGLGIAVCLENLLRGPTSHPENVAAWARASGAMITLDIGHAVSCQRVQCGELTALDFLEMVADRLFEVHMYERETDRHHPPQDMTILGPIVDRLLVTRCTWWTIELDDYAEALATRSLLLNYLH